jgi:hypothetical protein
MNHAGWKIVLALLALCVSFTAAAGEEPGVWFSRGDWEIACDNTLTCRMAGYCPEKEDDSLYCGSVLISRATGPNAPLQGMVMLGDSDYEKHLVVFDPPAILTFRIDGKSQGKLKLLERYPSRYPLTPTQIEALLAAARRDRAVVFEGKIADFEGTFEGKPVKHEGRFASFTLSGNGVSAVMLKMDEMQGRIGTPGALIRKGEKPEESVFPPRPVPVIRAVRVSDAPPRALTAPEVVALKPLLRGCASDDPESREAIDFPEITLTPLDEGHVLISRMCFAYHAEYGYWVMDSALKGKPKLVTVGGEYGEGVIDSRGSSWVWDGQEFCPSAQWSTGMRQYRFDFGSFGGTWYLPTLVTKVVNEDGTPRALHLIRP